MKRFFDIAISLPLLLATLPLIVFLALVVRLSSSGPGIFRQVRVGREHRNFTCYKLRTMASGTRDAASHLVGTDSITPLGRILRRHKFDELPQLWNVLRGDMSLVGPRPCLPVQDELIAAREARNVFSVRPGITGMAQVQGIDMSQPELLAEVDAEYVRNVSLILDISLLWRTFRGTGRNIDAAVAK